MKNFDQLKPTDGKSIGVLFARVLTVNAEFISDIYDCGEKGVLFDKPRFLDVKTLTDDDGKEIPGKVGVDYHKLVNPFCPKTHDQICVSHEHVVYVSPVDPKMVDSYKRETSRIIQPSAPSLTLPGRV